MDLKICENWNIIVNTCWGFHRLIFDSFFCNEKSRACLQKAGTIRNLETEPDLSKPFCSSLGIIGFIILLTKKWVAAAGIGPDIGEGDFACCPLLQQELVVLIEEENAEGPMKHSMGLGLVESVHVVLAGMSQNLVCLTHCDALICGHEVMLTARP